MSRHRSRVLALLVLLAALQPEVVRGEPIDLAGSLKGISGSVDLPVGWRSEPAATGFSSASGEAHLRVLQFAPGEFADAKSVSDSVQAALHATGEGSAFSYAGMPSFIADITFEAGGIPFRGYLITFLGRQRSIALLGFATTAAYDRLHDELLSALDSYSPEPELTMFPGPVSQFLYPFPAPHRVPMKLYLGKKEVQGGIDVREIEVSQSIIDRETRVLAENRKVNVEAWRRFYRMIYRDNYHRLDAYITVLTETLSLDSKPPAERAQTVLSWMQGFLYARTGTLADLSNPLLTLATQTGDCDSRTLLYSIIMRHIGVENVLLVSSVYSHSMVGVLVDGKGARIAHGGRDYLVAELTAPVAIGMIDRQMSDPAGWVAVDLSANALRPSLRHTVAP